MLVLCYWIIDVKKYSFGTKPFLAFGSNAISAYMLAELIANLMYSITFSYNGAEISLKGYLFKMASFDFIDPRLTSLFLAIALVLIIYIPIHILYKKKLFIKV
jgi:predicted acyltransferase